MRWVQVAPRVAARGSAVTLVTWVPDHAHRSHRGLVLETDDPEGDVERLRAHGLEFPAGVQQQPWGAFVTFGDPDGNGLVLRATRARRPRSRPLPRPTGHDDAAPGMAAPARGLPRA